MMLTPKKTPRLRFALALAGGAAFALSSAGPAPAAGALDAALPAYKADGPAAKPPRGALYVERDGAIRIGGAETAEEVLKGIDALYATAHPGVRFDLALKGTSTGIPLLAHGVTPFAPMGRGVTKIELVPYEKIVGEKPLEIRIAHTAYASDHLATSLGVYVNAANPIDRLTVEEVARIFTRANPQGDLSAWGQLGETGEWARAAIHPVAGSEYAGFGSYLEKAHFHGRMLAAGVEPYPNTAAVLKRVSQDSLAIGIAASGRRDPGVKMVALAGKAGEPYGAGEPGSPNAADYPFSRALYVYVRKEPGKPLDPFVKDYLRFVLSKEGQAVIAGQADGYIPLTAAEAAEERAKLDMVK